MSHTGTVRLSKEAQFVAEHIIKVGHVPAEIVVDPYDHLTQQDVLDIENFLNEGNDRKGLTFTQNKMRENI